MPSCRAAATTGANISSDSSMVRLRLRRAKLSVAEPKTAMSRAPAAWARSRPAWLGTSTGKRTPSGGSQHREKDLGVAELRHPLGGDETGGLDRAQPGRDQSGE